VAWRLVEIDTVHLHGAMVGHFVRGQAGVVEWWFVGFDKVRPPNKLKHSLQSLSSTHDAHTSVGRVGPTGFTCSIGLNATGGRLRGLIQPLWVIRIPRSFSCIVSGPEFVDRG
jgi:hypothetical protein